MQVAFGLGLGLPFGSSQPGSGGTAPTVGDALLLETSGYILLEDGSKTLLE